MQHAVLAHPEVLSVTWNKRRWGLQRGWIPPIPLQRKPPNLTTGWGGGMLIHCKKIANWRQRNLTRESWACPCPSGVGYRVQLRVATLHHRESSCQVKVLPYFWNKHLFLLPRKIILLQHKRHDFNNKYLLMCTTIYQVNYYMINERKREARGEIERRGKERKIA